MSYALWWLGTIGVVYALLYLIIYSTSTASDDIRKSNSFMEAFQGTALFILVWVTFTTIASIFNCTVRTYTERGPSLVAVKNHDSVEGSFIFGTGSFGTTNKYRVYVNVDGAVFQKEYNAKYAGIVEDVESYDAYVEVTKTVGEPGKFLTRHYISHGCNCNPVEVGWKLHVPKGTVVQEFNIE